MKNKFTFLFNPFVRIAGWKAFGIGIVILIAATYIGTINGVCFPGVIDVKFTSGVHPVNAFVYQVIGLLSVMVVMYLAALVFARGTRLQDVIGTTTLAHYPYLFIALFGFLSNREVVGNIEEAAKTLNMAELVSIFQDNIMLIVSALLIIPFSIWYIVLLYNAFSVSTGLKGGKAIAIYIGILFIAEIISIVSIVFILKNGA